ncbi:unnamed protein product [Cuscuta epithymum]|uniref:Uncharacterized protein n=1 Tax=Cuscuta epithymum TaxID=186058 RepID=A0AAV0DB64_9ASTE|nr:unnamed protein product [Cuscuta epithymum]
MMQSETLPILESPLKKPKLGAEERRPNKFLIGVSSEDDGGLGHINDKNLIEEYLKYERQVIESEGFDVDFVPRAFRRIFGSHIFPCKLDDPKEMEFIQECTDFTIAQYNRLMKSKSHLQLVKIVKANKRSSYNHAFFITFEALNTVSNQSATYTYQAKVFCGHGRDYKELLFIRRKDQMKDILFPVDLKDKEEYKRIKKCIDYGLYENRDMLDNILKSQLMQLQLTRIVNAVQNTTDHRIYRIVFEAMDVRTRQTDTYFAEANYASRVENDLVGMPYLWRKGQKNHEYDGEFEEEDWRCLENGVLRCL